MFWFTLWKKRRFSYLRHLQSCNAYAFAVLFVMVRCTQQEGFLFVKVGSAKSAVYFNPNASGNRRIGVVIFYSEVVRTTYGLV